MVCCLAQPVTSVLLRLAVLTGVLPGGCICTVPKNPCPPVLAVMAPADRAAAAQAADTVSSWEQIAGLVLYLDPAITMEESAGIVRAILDASSLPLIIQLPYEQPFMWADCLAPLAPAGFVIGAPPEGRLRRPGGSWLQGYLHSPALVPYYASVIAMTVRCGIPIIARSDASSTGDVLTLVAAGAEAVMLEGALWAQPDLAASILGELVLLAKQVGASSWQEFTRFLRIEQASAPDRSG